MSQKIDIDFNILSNPYYLKVLDFSEWGVIEGQPSIIEITLPGYTKIITHYFDKHKTNVYNSIALKVNCFEECGEVDKVTLPDGIYKIKVIGSPSTYNKEYFYLKTDLFDMEVDKLYIDNKKGNKNQDLMNRITELNFLVEGAKAHLRFDDITMAGIKFQQAVEMVEDFKNCKTCN